MGRDEGGTGGCACAPAQTLSHPHSACRFISMGQVGVQGSGHPSGFARCCRRTRSTPAAAAAGAAGSPRARHSKLDSGVFHPFHSRCFSSIPFQSIPFQSIPFQSIQSICDGDAAMAPAAGLLLGGRDLAARRCGAEEAEEDVPAEWDMSPEDQAAAQAVLDEDGEEGALCLPASAPASASASAGCRLPHTQHPPCPRLQRRARAGSCPSPRKRGGTLDTHTMRASRPNTNHSEPIKDNNTKRHSKLIILGPRGSEPTFWPKRG